MIGRVLFNLFSHITIKYFTSSHVFLILIMGEISSLDWRKKNFGEIVTSIVIFFIEFIMIFIFCEIIELNFCGLEKNTRKNIQERAQSEQYEEVDENNKQHERVEIEDGLIIDLDSQSSVNGNDN